MRGRIYRQIYLSSTLIIVGSEGSDGGSNSVCPRVRPPSAPGSCKAAPPPINPSHPPMSQPYDLLAHAHERALEFLNSLPDRPVAPRASFEELMAALGGPLQEAAQDPVSIVLDLSTRLEPGVAATAGPRYFGFVTGGAIRSRWRRTGSSRPGTRTPRFTSCRRPCRRSRPCTARWILDLLGLPERRASVS